MEDKTKNIPEVDPLTQDKYHGDHEFDGIKELANNPPWWLTIVFLVTVVIAYAYFAHYHIFEQGDSQEEEYLKEMAAFAPVEEEEEAEGLVIEEIDYTVAAVDEKHLKKGASVYKTNCAVCHLAEGQGLVGPNLTDEYWLHGGSLDDLVKTITDGVVEKGMISWKNQLNKKQIYQVSSYILTLQGTNPPNPKAPQGEKYVSN